MNAMDSVNVNVTGGICKDERYGFSQCYYSRVFMKG